MTTIELILFCLVVVLAVEVWFLRGKVNEHEGHLTEIYWMISRGAQTDRALQEVIKRLADRVLDPPVAPGGAPSPQNIPYADPMRAAQPSRREK